MLIKDRMTRNPITIQAGASVSSLIALMRENKLKKVPVLDGEKLVGLVTDRDVEKVSPSAATTLSVFEINYLLSKATVRDAMSKEFFTCTPDTLVEDAAVLMRENRVNAICVVNEEGRLIGLVTESDLFDAVIDMLGGRTPGNKFVLELDNVPGVLQKLGTAASEKGINILNIAVVSVGPGKVHMMITTAPDTTLETARSAIESEGFRILSESVKR